MTEERTPRRWGKNREEYDDYHTQLKRGGYETNVWGKYCTVSAEEAHEIMWDRRHGVQQFRLPRVVGERIDISANAKIVYGALTNYPLGTQMYLYEIAGLCGMSAYRAYRAIYDLKEAGLLEVSKRYRPNSRLRAPSFYKVIQPPNRFKKIDTPMFLRTDISNIEEELRARFNDLKP